MRITALTLSILVLALLGGVPAGADVLCYYLVKPDGSITSYQRPPFDIGGDQSVDSSQGRIIIAAAQKCRDDVVVKAAPKAQESAAAPPAKAQPIKQKPAAPQPPQFRLIPAKPATQKQQSAATQTTNRGATITSTTAAGARHTASQNQGQRTQGGRSRPDDESATDGNEQGPETECGTTRG